MAYFGGTVSAKPWSKIDARFALLFALSFGGITASVLTAQNLLQSSESSRLTSPQASVSVPRRAMTLTLVTVKEIRAGTKILPSMFKLESRELGDSDQGTVKDLDEIVGQYARVDIAQSTPLIRSVLTNSNAESQDVGERIPTGYRAVAIPINALTGVEGWVRPGAHVDVVWSTEREKQFVVVTIVENARVLSVERSLDTEQPSSGIVATPPSHITLVVSSADAQKIQLAKSSGSLSLSLRGTDDHIGSDTSFLTSENLLLRRNVRDEVKGKVIIDGTEYGFLRGKLVPMSDLEKAVVNN